MTAEPTVYIVDDDDAVLRSLEALLRSQNYRTAGFPSAEEFLNAYDAAKPGCLITDLRLAGLSGLQLQQHLNELREKLPVIVITGFADVSITVRVMAEGAITLLEKPIDRGELVKHVELALEQSRAVLAIRAQEVSVEEKIALLTEDEREVMDLMVQGVSSKEMTSVLEISPRTCDRRRRSVLEKMGVDSPAQLAALVTEFRIRSELD